MAHVEGDVDITRAGHPKSGRAARASANAEDPAAAAFARLTSALAHEVRNPLNTLSLTFQFVERLIAREAEKLSRHGEIERHLSTGAREVDRIKRLVEACVDLARPVRPAIEEAVDLSTVVAKALETERSRRSGGPAGAEVVLAPGASEARLHADPAELQLAIEALIANAFDAFDAAAAAGEKAAARRRIEFDSGPGHPGSVRITVRDTGPGFDEKALRRAFEPLFTTRPGHAGAGLARARAIVEAHGGAIHAGNRDGGGGAEVVIELPATPGVSGGGAP